MSLRYVAPRTNTLIWRTLSAPCEESNSTAYLKKIREVDQHVAELGMLAGGVETGGNHQTRLPTFREPCVDSELVETQS